VTGQTGSGLPPPTEDVARLVELIGDAATLRLLEARGGVRIYIADPAEGRALVEIVGLDAAAALQGKYGNTRIKVPVGRQWRVLCYKARGLSRPQIALKVGCSETTVDDIIKRYGRPATSQLDLFARSA
jgi:DNA-binding NarL/FixJ family response regulator